MSYEFKMGDDNVVVESGIGYYDNGSARIYMAYDEQNVYFAVEVEDKNYYAVNGKLTGGWISINEEWYYFDKTTFAGNDGRRFAGTNVSYMFDNGRLVSGEWERVEKGSRYWYGPGFYRRTYATIDGKEYYFGTDAYMYTGIRFIEYVNHYRVNEARFLLRYSNKTILSVALECGFDSLRNFNRVFKKIAEQTPSEYRRTMTMM